MIEKPKSKKKYNALGINVYGGGFTLGMMNHFNIHGQWEEISLGATTFEKNFAWLDHPMKHKDWPVDKFKGKLDVVYGNPPCAPWSNAGNFLGRTKASRFEDPRLMLTEHTMQAALALEPTIFVLESVENAYNYGVRHYDQYVDAWLKKGYAVTFFLTNAVLHGLPSWRRRFHFIAHKVDLKWPTTPNPDTVVIKSVRDVIGDLEHKPFSGLHMPIPGCKELQPYYKHIKQGQHIMQVMRKKFPEYKGAKMLESAKRFHYDTAASTLVGFAYVHPTQHRLLTFLEGQRLLGFPDEFQGVFNNVIGVCDTVTPTIANFFGELFKKSLTANKNARAEHTTIDWRPLADKFQWRRLFGVTSYE